MTLTQNHVDVIEPWFVGALMIAAFFLGSFVGINSGNAEAATCERACGTHRVLLCRKLEHPTTAGQIAVAVCADELDAVLEVLP